MLCTMAGGYQAWFALVSDWIAGWSEAERRQFLGGNAQRFYRL